MAQVNANGEEGNPNGPGAAQRPGQQPGLMPNGVPNAAAAAHVADVVANTVIANLAGVLAPPAGPMHPQFDDVEAALLGPPPTKSNRNFNIHARIKFSN